MTLETGAPVFVSPFSTSLNGPQRPGRSPLGRELRWSVGVEGPLYVLVSTVCLFLPSTDGSL